MRIYEIDGPAAVGMGSRRLRPPRERFTRNVRSLLAAAALAIAGCSGSGSSPPGAGGGSGGAPGLPWLGFANDAQHSAQSASSPQPLNAIHWKAVLDLAPHYDRGELLAHYGSPVITADNTVIAGVKTGASGGFRVEARTGASGALLWQAASDYVLPAHQWVPSYNPVLSASGRLYFPGSGAKLFYRAAPDSPQGSLGIAVFYGSAAYASAKAVYDTAVAIDTPLTVDAQGTIYFGFTVSGPTPLNLRSGIARVDAAGHGTWVAAADAAGDASIVQVAMNCAPALSPDGRTLYIAATNGTSGYLLALDSASLRTRSKAALQDPSTGQPAGISGNSTSSPTVGPDGDVYYGVLETAIGEHNDRGWLLHFDATLAQQKTPGSFGWDDTASILPSSMFPAYIGASPYLIMTKYNNYGGIGTGNGQNEIAVLDPRATQPDPVIPSVTVMKEVLVKLGQTPDPAYPGGVREWCINSAAVAPAAKAVFANSEDGYLYQWDLPSNSLSRRIQLTSGIGEAYTPTAIGPDGQVYAVNNAVLFAIGR